MGSPALCSRALGVLSPKPPSVRGSKRFSARSQRVTGEAGTCPDARWDCQVYCKAAQGHQAPQTGPALPPTRPERRETLSHACAHPHTGVGMHVSAGKHMKPNTDTLLCGGVPQGTTLTWIHTQACTHASAHVHGRAHSLTHMHRPSRLERESRVGVRSSPPCPGLLENCEATGARSGRTDKRPQCSGCPRPACQPSGSDTTASWALGFARLAREALRCWSGADPGQPGEPTAELRLQPPAETKFRLAQCQASWQTHT